MKKILLFLLFSISIYCTNPTVTFLCPSPPGDGFWDKVRLYMSLAANDLEIDLRIVNPDEMNRFAIKKTAIKEIITYNPEYLIFPYPSMQGKEILDFAENQKTKCVIINMDIPDNEKNIVKTPGELYKNWIAHIYPDDELAGYNLGKILIDSAIKKYGISEKIELIAINGSRDIDVSVDRERGLLKVLNEYKQAVKLNQVFYSNWEYKNAYDIAYNALKRYPKSAIIWAASDDISIASMNAAKDLEKSIVTGGIDWSDEGFISVKNKTIISTLGGHFFDGVIALVLIKDYSSGININDYKTVKSKFYAADINSTKYLENLISKDNVDKYDFKKISKFYNKELKVYNFNIIDLLKK